MMEFVHPRARLQGLTLVFEILLVKASARLRLTKEAKLHFNLGIRIQAIIGANDAIASVRAKPKMA